MEIPRQRSSTRSASREKHDKAAQAIQRLPDTVDTDQHRDILDRLGIDPSAILGGLGDKLGL